VRWVVPYTAGGGYDVYSRLLEPYYERAIGAQIVVENRGGGSTLSSGALIRDAEPDGTTLGIMNGTSLALQLIGNVDFGFDLRSDVTIIGRVSTAHPTLFAGPSSPYRSIDDVMRPETGKRPVFSVADIGGTGFIWIVIAAEVLQLEVDFLLGYPGTRESSLGLIRGDADVAGYTYQSVADHVVAGDLRPLLQVTPPAWLADEPALDGVPFLDGAGGVAVQRAHELGQDPDRARVLAEALRRMMQLGRLVIAPPGLAPELASCLREAFEEVMTDPEFRAAASRAERSLAFADGEAVLSDLDAAMAEQQRLEAALTRQVRRVRGIPEPR